MAEKAQAEPTMEEILASIRKIISDEGGDETAHETASPASETAAEEGDTVSIRTTEDDDFENLSLDDVIEKTGGSAEALGQEAGDDLDPIGQTTPQEEEFPGDISESMFEEGDDPLELSEDDRIDNDNTEELEDFDLDVMSFEDEAAEADAGTVGDPFATADTGWDTGLAEAESAVEPTTVMPETDMSDPAPEPDPEPQSASQPETAAAAVHEEPAMTTDTPETTSQASSGLTDDRIAGAAASALGKLMVKEHRKADDDGDPNTVEGLLRQMLRPMIKEWLDANLPDIVERKVEEEVQRIARMAR